MYNKSLQAQEFSKQNISKFNENWQKEMEKLDEKQKSLVLTTVKSLAEHQKAKEERLNFAVQELKTSHMKNVESAKRNLI